MKPLRLISSLALAVSALASPAMAQDFQPYEGKNAVHEGQGGVKKVVDGVEFWSDGAPPKPFQLLGYITDRRHKTGLIGMFRMSGLESSVAAVAKQNGADAVILVSSTAETVGTASSTFGTAQGTANATGGTPQFGGTFQGNTMTAPAQKQNSRYAVVRYVAPASVEPRPPTTVVPSEGAASSASTPVSEQGGGPASFQQ